MVVDLVDDVERHADAPEQHREAVVRVTVAADGDLDVDVAVLQVRLGDARVLRESGRVQRRSGHAE